MNSSPGRGGDDVTAARQRDPAASRPIWRSNSIAGGVAAGIIDHLEQVEIEMAQRVLGAVAAAAFDGCLQALLELAPGAGR